MVLRSEDGGSAHFACREDMQAVELSMVHRMASRLVPDSNSLVLTWEEH